MLQSTALCFLQLRSPEFDDYFVMIAKIVRHCCCSALVCKAVVNSSLSSQPHSPLVTDGEGVASILLHIFALSGGPVDAAAAAFSFHVLWLLLMVWTVCVFCWICAFGGNSTKHRARKA